MPLIMGEWKLFMDKKQLSLNFSGIDNRGHFFCDSELIPGVQEKLHGEGYWNELANKISFFMYAESAGGESYIHIFFNGYQTEGIPTEHPASDKLWTLTGSYQISGVKMDLQDALQLLGITVQNSRRQEYGWYAQKTEVI